ncbi:MAG: hypothetical protein CL840_10950 [Crocinitomicaceae bacterium]|nr:hypothetical protein [Crocinitomicaceae bacterium]|tara:strand:+ start:18769 stop:19332 length:564 start_codon:yes stop_codon:yes gene_type:complete
MKNSISNVIRIPFIGQSLFKGVMFFLLLFFFGTEIFAQEGTQGNPPCPPFSASTEFCFENSLLYDNCEKTICISYTPTAGKETELANCPAPAPGYLCVTIAPGSNGCINVPHPVGEFADWFDIIITVRSNGSGATATFSSYGLRTAVENESSHYENSPAGAGCSGSNATFLGTSDGRNFIIENRYTL